MEDLHAHASPKEDAEPDPQTMNPGLPKEDKQSKAKQNVFAILVGFISVFVII